jgi:peptidoglycan/xylan/chitin deacetylase (PgdA/CDA1 family)
MKTKNIPPIQKKIWILALMTIFITQTSLAVQEESHFFQFDENYHIITDANNDNDIFPIISSSFTGDMAGAILQLSDAGDRIGYDFEIPQTQTYTIKIVGYTSYNTPNNPYERLDRTKVFIDNIEYTPQAGNPLECQTVWNWQYCPYTIEIELNQGSHTLEIEGTSRLRIDRFSYIYETNNTTSNQEIIYTSPWYNIEENYVELVDAGSNNIIPLVGYESFSGDMAQGVLQLGDTNDKIRHPFTIDETGNYKIDIVSYTGYNTPETPYERIDRTKVFLDGIELPKTIGNESQCQTVWNWHYCPYTIEKSLSAGTHTLEFESANEKLRLDRFRYNLLAGQTVLWVPIQEDTIPIFGYHSVLEDSQTITQPTLQLKESDFIEQIDYATNTLNCNWITFKDAMNYITNNNKIPQNTCVLNFDDGRIDNYEIVHPILESRNIPATFFIITNYTNQGFSNYMNWTQIEELKNSGHEIAAHTQNHHDLTTLTLSQAQTEIEGSKQDLQTQGFTPITFSYPYGAWNNDVVNIVKNDWKSRIFFFYVFNPEGGLGVGSRTERPSQIDSGEWFHFVGVYTGEENRVYKDGVHTDTDPTIDHPDYGTMTLANGDGDFNIGWNDNSGGWFAGDIDNVMIYDRVLSQSEIVQIYNAQRSDVLSQ